MKKKEDDLLEHDYDGIKEYDNDLPNWWVWLFWITIIGGGIYAIYFHNPLVPTPLQRLEADLESIEKLKDDMAVESGVAELTDEDLLLLVSDKSRISKGQELYVGKCMPCHGDKGQGTIGPNLTDEYWIHGGKPTDIKRIIVDGVQEKGMLAWKNIINNEDIDSLVAFTLSLAGTNPEGAKGPEGDLFKNNKK